jgi:hypothetical protein
VAATAQEPQVMVFVVESAEQAEEVRAAMLYLNAIPDAPAIIPEFIIVGSATEALGRSGYWDANSIRYQLGLEQIAVVDLTR